MIPAVARRRERIERVREEWRVLRPAIDALHQAFAPELARAEFVRLHMIEPVFGEGVNLSNYGMATASCMECERVHLGVCSCGAPPERTIYR